MMGEKVKIVLKTKIHTIEADEDQFELTLFGTLNWKDGALYIRYKEQTLEGEVSNTIKYKNKTVTVIRTGAMRTRQTFQPKSETSALLENLSGNIHLTFQTYRVEHQQNETRDTNILHFSYDLAVQFEPVGRYEVTLTATKVL